MVGMMASNSRERVASLINSVKIAINAPLKLQYLRQLKDELSLGDSTLLSEFLPRLTELLTDRFSPVRKFIIEMIGEIGLKHMEFLPEIVPVIVTVSKDATPAVSRQAITCATDLYRITLEKVAIKGLYSSEIDELLESSWAWMQKLREEIYSIAFQPGSDGARLLALKFVESVILLYTPDPNGSLEPPSRQDLEGNIVEFNISWLRGRHPLLNVGDLSIEASQSLGSLLGLLRFPSVKSLGNLVVIVLINSLSTIAKKRPAFYGRILPVLLGLDPSSSIIKGVQVFGAHHALRNAFLSCLKCTHPSAAPWKERLVGALRELKAEDLAEEVFHQVSKRNGSIGDGGDDSPSTRDDKSSTKANDIVEINRGKKRSGVHENESNDLAEEDDSSGKRVRKTTPVSEGSSKEVDDGTGLRISREDSDTGPVQQLVSMFGALVAQGEKAHGSLEILISSISSDLLAEVVMANMRHLPANRPKIEDEELPLNMGLGIGATDHLAKHPFSILANVLSLSSSFPQIASLLDAKQASPSDIAKPQEEVEHSVATVADDAASSMIDYGTEKDAVLTASIPASSNIVVPLEMEERSSLIPSEIHEAEDLASDIPGLHSTVHNDGFTEKKLGYSLVSIKSEEPSFGGSSLDGLPSISTDRSEELSPKATVTETNSVIASTATSVSSFTQIILPKMSAPVVNLADEQKDTIQKMTFTRIIEAYKQTAVSEGSHVRFPLLAYLGIEFPLELDPWKLLQDHILSDYLNHEGHELTLRVLYRLFGEAEEGRDFFSSTTATSVYETFLLTVAEALRDSFPPSDKSLSRLLAEVPYLPKSAFKLLEGLCSPGNGDKVEKEVQGGDRVTQGLSIVWNLIMLRPPLRHTCLRIALQSAVHHMEEVRMKAIRLVANKLYPLSSITQKIEDFAKETLLSVIDNANSAAETDAEGSSVEQKDSNLDKPLTENPSESSNAKDISFDTPQASTSQSTSGSSLSEAQRSMALYFALCTKKHTLFRQIFVIYKSTSKLAKQAVHRHIPILVRTIGSSTELLEIISDPPPGSEHLLMQVLRTLTDGTIPSPELIFTIRKLYDSKLKDAEILIPILPFLPKNEILLIFSHIVNLPPDKFQAALASVLKGPSPSGPVLTPSEVLIAIHGIDPDRDGIPLKKVTDACNACFEQRQIFTQQVLAKVLNQLVEQIPLPLLFMRTVLQAINAFPGLVEFILEILSRLVSKQIWKYPKLWVGFLKCALVTKPQSFSVLLQLPPAQLENALNRTAPLREPLVAHASQPNIRSSLPRSVLVVLGIAPDSQTPSQAQAQATQVQTQEANNSDKEAAAEKAKESSTAN